MKRTCFFILLSLLIISLFSCHLNENKKIPFLSFSFYDRNDKNNIFLNYWDIGKGKVYLNHKRLYKGYRRGVNTDVFPYFWDGKKKIFLNCLLRDKAIDMDFILSDPSYSKERFYSFSMDGEIFYVDLLWEDKILNIYREENGNIKILSSFDISNLLPDDVMKGGCLKPYFLFKEDNEMIILLTYPSKNMMEKNTMTEKLFIYRVKDRAINFIKTEGISDYSLNFSVMGYMFKRIFKSKDRIFLSLCMRDGCGKVYSVNLKTGNMTPLKLKSKEEVSVSFIGGFSDYLILYTPWRIYCVKDGKVIGKIIIDGDEGKINVYKGNRLTERIDIDNIYPNIMFPNIEVER